MGRRMTTYFDLGPLLSSDAVTLTLLDTLTMGVGVYSLVSHPEGHLQYGC